MAAASVRPPKRTATKNSQNAREHDATRAHKSGNPLEVIKQALDKPQDSRVLYKGYRYKVLLEDKKTFITTRDGPVSMIKVAAWQKRDQAKCRVYIGARSKKVGGGATTCDNTLEEFQEIVDIPSNGLTIHKNSGNCVFGLPMGREVEPVPYFVKFQLNPKTDDVVVDALNSIVISAIGKELNIDVHFPEYIASYPLPLAIHGDGYKMKATYENEHGLQCYNSVVYKAVKCPESLQMVVDKIQSREDYESSDLKRMLGNLFSALFRAGREYGFVHNDPHLQNVLHDTVARELVIIDFGRSYVDETEGLEGVDEAVAALVNHYPMRGDLENLEYKTFIRNKISLGQGYHWVNSVIAQYVREDLRASFIRSMVMCDISAFTAKLVFTRSGFIQSAQNGRLKKINSRMFLYKRQALLATTHDVYLPGLYWLSMFFEAVLSFKTSTRPGDVSNNKIIDTGESYDIDMMSITSWLSGDLTFISLSESYGYRPPERGHDQLLTAFCTLIKNNQAELDQLCDECWVYNPNPPKSNKDPHCPSASIAYQVTGSTPVTPSLSSTGGSRGRAGVASRRNGGRGGARVK